MEPARADRRRRAVKVSAAAAEVTQMRGRAWAWVVLGIAGVLISASGASAADRPVEATPAPGRMSALAPIQAVGHDFGHLMIPAIGVDEPIREGVALSVIDRGVAHWVGTARPGSKGNVVLAGHRTTHSAPFHDLDRLEPGDRIFVSGPGGVDALYRVSEVFIVSPKDVWITYEMGRPMMTMFACHPKGSYAQRIVVQAELVSATPLR